MDGKDFPPQMNMFQSIFYVNDITDREDFPRKYQCTNFSVSITPKKHECSQVLMYIMVDVHSEVVLQEIFTAPSTLYISLTLHVKDYA